MDFYSEASKAASVKGALKKRLPDTGENLEVCHRPRIYIKGLGDNGTGEEKKMMIRATMKEEKKFSFRKEKNRKEI